MTRVRFWSSFELLLRGFLLCLFPKDWKAVCVGYFFGVLLYICIFCLLDFFSFSLVLSSPFLMEFAFVAHRKRKKENLFMLICLKAQVQIHEH